MSQADRNVLPEIGSKDNSAWCDNENDDYDEDDMPKNVMAAMAKYHQSQSSKKFYFPGKTSFKN